MSRGVKTTANEFFSVYLPCVHIATWVSKTKTFSIHDNLVLHRSPCVSASMKLAKRKRMPSEAARKEEENRTRQHFGYYYYVVSQEKSRRF